eukprot:1154869-Pelagomonas_calceolata.AAC.2
MWIKVTSSTSCLTLLITVERNFLKSASGARKFIGVLDKTSVKLQSKLGDLVSVKTKLSKRLQNVGDVDDPAHT